MTYENIHYATGKSPDDSSSSQEIPTDVHAAENSTIFLSLFSILAEEESRQKSRSICLSKGYPMGAYKVPDMLTTKKDK